jgi:MFS family permease
VSRPALSPRFAVSTIFFCLGIAFGTWAARLAEIKGHIHASNGVLGLTLSAVTVGSLLSMLFVGGAIARFGSRRMTMAGTAGMLLVLPLLALVRTAPQLAGLLFVYGVTIAWMDVSMNTQAVLVEKQAGRSLMSGFHAWFSVGGLAGAGLSALVATELSTAPHFALTAAALAVLALVAAPRMIHGDAEEGHSGLQIQRVPRALVPLAILIFCGLVGEGAAESWSGVYLNETIEVSKRVVPAGFAAFSLMMAIGRFCGDAARMRLGAARLVFGSGLLAAAGMGLAVLWPEPAPVIVGFGLLGLGLAPVYPSVMTAAGNSGVVRPGEAVALIGMVGWLAFLISPPVVGGIAEAASLRIALGVVAGVVFLVAPLAVTLRRGGAREPAAPASATATE